MSARGPLGRGAPPPRNPGGPAAGAGGAGTALDDQRLPYPERLVEAWRRAGQSLATHPEYWLTSMVPWTPRDASGQPPAGPEAWCQRDADKKGAIRRAAYAINDAERCRLAEAALARRRGWLAPLERQGRARRLRLVATTDAVTWLASPGPLEVGLALHHVYGFPVLPGSSLKGVALRAAQVREAGSAGARYGTSESGAAAVTILDGFPAESWTVELDVMTPHFGGWYRGEGPPDDTESPVPVNFLVLRRRSVFEIALVARGPRDAAQLDGAVEDLRTGLDELGLGAKTAAGYGVFTVEPCPPSGGRAGAAGEPAATGPAAVAPARSAQTSAMLAQIASLRRNEVRGRLGGLLGTIAACPEDERAELVDALRRRLRELGLKDAELRELEKQHPGLRQPS
jgi:CRISPR-associated protein Cmr6